MSFACAPLHQKRIWADAIFSKIMDIAAFRTVFVRKNRSIIFPFQADRIVKVVPIFN